MKDLYNLDVDECVELVKRNIVDCIYSSAKIEGIAVSYFDVQQIYDGRSVSGLNIDDLNRIYKLKSAWWYILHTLNIPLNIMYLESVHRFASIDLFAGETKEVILIKQESGGYLSLPRPDQTEEIDRLMRIECITERAINIMLYIMRTQIFGEGNNRVAQLAANQILIKDGKGYLKIPEDKITTFFDLLIKYYETNDSKEVAEFVYNTSIQGKIIVKKQDNPPIDESMFYKTKPDATKHHPRR